MPQGDIAGPVVKTTAAATTAKQHHAADHVAAGIIPADAAADAAATDKDAAASKKTIAQMLDEALEQEFPKEAEAAQGKNYNETAKKEDVCVVGRRGGGGEWGARPHHCVYIHRSPFFLCMHTHMRAHSYIYTPRPRWRQLSK